MEPGQARHDHRQGNVLVDFPGVAAAGEMIDGLGGAGKDHLHADEDPGRGQAELEQVEAVDEPARRKYIDAGPGWPGRWK